MNSILYFYAIHIQLCYSMLQLVDFWHLEVSVEVHHFVTGVAHSKSWITVRILNDDSAMTRWLRWLGDPAVFKKEEPPMQSSWRVHVWWSSFLCSPFFCWDIAFLVRHALSSGRWSVICAWVYHVQRSIYSGAYPVVDGCCMVLLFLFQTCSGLEEKVGEW